MLGLTAMTPRSKLALWLLMAAGLLANAFPLPMLPAVDFLFGSIAAMIVLHGYGLGWGALSALVAGSYTLVLWHHPYALLLFVAEVLFVGLLLRPNRSIVLLDGLFWVVLGMPLVWLFYRRVLGIEADETRLVMLKDAVNGIFNALLASLLVLHSPLRAIAHAQAPEPMSSEPKALKPATAEPSATTAGLPAHAARPPGQQPTQHPVRQPARARVVSLSQAIFNMAVGCVLLPALLLIILDSRQNRANGESDLHADLKANATAVSNTLERWQHRRLDTVTQLARLGTAANLQDSPSLQRDLELLARASPDFIGLCIAALPSPGAAPSRALAVYPARDASGRPNSAADFATPGHLQRLRSTRHGIVSEVFTPPVPLRRTSAPARGEPRQPVMALHAPIFRDGRFRGYAAGIIDLASLRMLLTHSLPAGTMRATIVDNRRRVVASTVARRRALQAFAHPPGTRHRFDATTYQWLPVRTGRLAIERWSDSIFVSETRLSGTPWRLITEAPLAPQWRSLGESNVHSLLLVLLLSLAALLLAALLSRSLTRPLAQLALMTTNLPARLAGGSPRGVAARSVPARSAAPGKTPEAQARSKQPDNEQAHREQASIGQPDSQKPDSQDSDGQQSGALPALTQDLVWPHSSVEEMDVLVGNFQSMVGTLQENFQAVETARGQLEEEQARLSEANRLKDEFLAILSHELRTPLVPVIGYADLLARGVLGGDETSDAARAIERNARHQLRLIEDLLDVSRIISGKLLMNTGTVSLLHVMRDAVATVQLSADAKKVGLTLSMPDEFRSIAGDEARLRQVMLNLIGNAIKFTPEGGQVYVTLEHTGDRAEITVADTGQGITPDFLPHVFDRFRQNADHLTRAAGGLGLGLSIVQHIVAAHGGRIEAHSEGEGRGSVFIVHLPMPPPPTAPLLPAPEPSSAQPGKPLTNRLAGATTRAATGRLHGATVLVVDDEADSRARLTAMLQREGARVADAVSAAAGLETALRDRPGIIISGLGMEHGAEFLQRVRAASTLQDVPVVAFTAQVSGQARSQTLNGGFNACLSKPVQAEDVIDLLESLMDRH